MLYNFKKQVFVAAFALAWVINAHADIVSATVATQAQPRAISIDTVTNKIYVADDSCITVIDGLSNSTTTLSTGNGGQLSYSVAVNPATNKVYVANENSNTVTVINGATSSAAATVATTVSVGTSPIAIAVNPVTNMIYVANYGSNNITVINGASNATATVTAGTEPVAIAVNLVTNMIYVANYGGTITIINGATNATASLTGGYEPFAIAANPVTNKIYVANYGTSGANSTVTVINGATNATAATVATSVTVGETPYGIAVNTATDMVYVANSASGFATSINGADNSTATITGVGENCIAIAVNAATNKVYLANYGGSTIIINGAADTMMSSLSAGTDPSAVAVNPATNMIYVANKGSANVTVIKGTITLSAPVLSSPANGSTNQPLSLTLTWGTVTNATSYAVQVSAVSTFASTVSNQTGLDMTSEVVSGLANSTSYYWHANATNSGGAGGWSSAWSFETVPAVPAVPTLTSPSNGAGFAPTATVALVWGSVPGAAIYTVEVSTVSTFATTLLNESGVTVSVAIANSLGTAHFWRVNAGNEGGTSAWSSIWSFTTSTAVFSTNGNGMQSSVVRFEHGVLSYRLRSQAQVEIMLFDILGKKVVNYGFLQTAGNHRLPLNQVALPSGRYLLRFKAGGVSQDLAITITR